VTFHYAASVHILIHSRPVTATQPATADINPQIPTGKHRINGDNSTTVFLAVNSPVTATDTAMYPNIRNAPAHMIRMGTETRGRI
jgi:hypothetical protein